MKEGVIQPIRRRAGELGGVTNLRMHHLQCRIMQRGVEADSFKGPQASESPPVQGLFQMDPGVLDLGVAL